MSRNSTEVIGLDTELGPARCYLDAAETPDAILVLGHGAGGGVTASDLELLARGLPPLGVTVARFEQPWRTAGGRVAVAPPRLDIAWQAGIEFLLRSEWTSPRLFFGGRSAGARVACRTASAFGVLGVVCLAFPLHLPGQPEKSRIAELLQPSVPRLVLQGSKDTFGSAAEVAAAAAGARDVHVVPLPGADHGFRLVKASPLSPAQLRATVLSEVAAFISAT